MLPHNPHAIYAHEQPNRGNKRRRIHAETADANGSGVAGERTAAVHGGGTLRACPYCGRTFKRTEHLERHVRTHTKEKPFVCNCGAAFARRDLLTRHHRLSSHEDGCVVDEQTSTPTAARAAEADLAAAVSLSGLSTDPWSSSQHLHTGPVVALHVDPSSHDARRVAVRTAYSQDLIPERLFEEPSPTGAIAPHDLDYQALTHNSSFDPHFREFANFLDGIGLPAEWSPYFNGPDRDRDEVDADLRESVPESPSPQQQHRQRPGTPFSAWLPSAPTGNHISNYASDNHPGSVDPESQRFKVTEEQRAKLNASVESLADILDPAFKLPSRHALTRYITSWFEGFHSHMPFIHCRTWSILDHSLELILGIAAIGAQYCFEHRSSRRLFYAGKSILMERLVRIPDSLGPRTSSHLALNSPSSRSRTQADSVPWEPIETVRALIVLMGYATWEPNASMVREAYALQGLLAQVLRDTGLEEQDCTAAPDRSSSPFDQRHQAHRQWLRWVDQESRRRSKLIAFSFLHTHSVAYNTYPVLRSNEVKLRLPCSTKEWKAASPSQWQAATKEVKKEQLYFQDALSLLLKNTNESAPLDPIPTPLGNYLLLHGLLQRIHIVRDLSLPVMSNTAALPSEEVDKLERGLRSWTAGWQQAAESSLDPNNENGPIPFTSSSLLALAYVRIHLHLGPYRQLDTRDPVVIARAISRSPSIERGDNIIAALLYSVHMLSIPVRLGVDRVAKSQAFFWSVRHSLSSLDCGILLSKWLWVVGDTIAETPLTDSEDRILHWVRSIVEEAYSVVELDEEDDQLGDFRNPRMLGLAVLRIWAHFFESNTQWPFINIIGAGLSRYRDLLVHGRRG